MICLSDNFLVEKLEEELDDFLDHGYVLVPDEREYRNEEVTAMFTEGYRTPRYVSVLARTDGSYIMSGGKIKERDYGQEKSKRVFSHEVHKQPMHDEFSECLEEIVDAVLN